MTQPPQYSQPSYDAPGYPPATTGYIPQQQSDEGLGGWVLTLFLTFIPLVNIIYLLVLAFGSTTSLAKRNFARASLIWMLVGIALTIVGFILMAIFGAALFNEIANTYPLPTDY